MNKKKSKKRTPNAILASCRMSKFSESSPVKENKNDSDLTDKHQDSSQKQEVFLTKYLT